MNNECWALLLAAGQGSRLAAATGGEAKQFLRRNGRAPVVAAARALTASPRVRGLVVVFPPERLDAATAELADLDRDHVLGVPWRTAAGGPRRQDSVRLGLAALPAACGTVLVHDGARPFLTPALVTRVADALTDSPTIPPADGAALPFGVVPGLPVTDTIKEVDAGNRVRRTPAAPICGPRKLRRHFGRRRWPKPHAGPRPKDGKSRTTPRLWNAPAIRWPWWKATRPIVK